MKSLIDSFNTRLPETELPIKPTQELSVLTIFLLSGYFLIAPLLGTLLKPFIPLPYLMAVGAVICLYAGVAVLTRHITKATLIATIIFSTCYANVPIVANDIPGAIVGEFLLVHLPLAALCVIAGVRGWRPNWQPSTLAFLGFVVATALPAIFQTAVNTSVALWFTAFAFQMFVFFWLLKAAVAHGVITLKDTAVVLGLTTIAQSILALAQLANGQAFGLTRLGEGQPTTLRQTMFPLFSDLTLGAYISGFTGFSFVLANLVVMATPILIILAWQTRPEWRSRIFAGGLIASGIALRSSTSDAARGGFFLALATLVGLLALYRTEIILTGLLKTKGKLAAGKPGAIILVTVLVVAVGAVAVPSSMSGSASNPIEPLPTETTTTTPTSPTPTQTDTSTLSSTSSATESTTPTQTETPTPSTTSEPPSGTTTAAESSDSNSGSIENLSVPLFDLTNLGVRFQLAAVGISVWEKHPIIGIGGANFQIIGPEYGLDVTTPSGLSYPIHNIFISLLVETGVLGLGCFLLVLWYVFRSVHHQLKTNQNPAIVAATAAGLIGAIGFGMFDILQIYYSAAVFPFWILSGALVGEANQNQ